MLVCVAVAGCGGGGGGGGPRYSKSPFVACLKQKGVTTLTLAQFASGMPASEAATLRSIAPDVIGATFPSNDFAAFVFAKNKSDAYKVYSTFRRLIGANSGTGHLSLVDNLVVVTTAHVSPGSAAVIDSCEKAALSGH